MTTINAHWSTRNTQRRYPLDDGVSALSDDGQALPNNIVADVALQYPGTPGTAYIASVVCRPHLVSVTFADTNGPLGAVSLAAPITPHRSYPVQSHIPGVAGWVVFGDAANTTEFFGTFQAAATALCPRAARAYTPAGVRSLGAIGARTGFTRDLVRLRAEAPLEIVGEQFYIDGRRQMVAVLRLRNTPGATESVYARFAGPCGARPESGTCPAPVPVETINGVGPDCDGRIWLEFRGVTLAVADNEAQLSVAQNREDACAPKRLPAADGTLPGTQEVDALTYISDFIDLEDE